MISVDEALELILKRFEPLEIEAVPILEALGQVTASNVVAPFDVPPLTNTAMDGYAIRAEDTLAAGGQPVSFRVVEDLPAGRRARSRVDAGCAIRIMTGAPLPNGADTVVPFEDTGEGRGEARGAEVIVYGPARRGQNVRLAGEDLRAGSVVLPRGTTIRPPEVGVLATMGLTRVSVHRRPRVGILSTGSEIVEPGAPLGPGKIHDANSFTIAAMVQVAGGIPVRLGIAADNVEDVVGVVARATDCDLLVTSAGVSVGDYDVVKKALATAGRFDLYQVRMRPGRPLAFGALGGTPLLGLPGNPVAAAISFELFGRPALMRMLGRRSWGRPEVTARFEGSIDNYDSRRSFYRVRLAQVSNGYVARLTGPQGSGILSSLVQANGLMVVDEATLRVSTGDAVCVRMLDGAGDE